MTVEVPCLFFVAIPKETADRPGIQVSHASRSGVNQRTYYTRWGEFMNAESWANPHLPDPGYVRRNLLLKIAAEGGLKLLDAAIGFFYIPVYRS